MPRSALRRGLNFLRFLRFYRNVVESNARLVGKWNAMVSGVMHFTASAAASFALWTARRRDLCMGY